MDKESLSERDICTKFITQALRVAGWDEIIQIREEVGFTKGAFPHLPVAKNSSGAWDEAGKELRSLAEQKDDLASFTAECLRLMNVRPSD